MNVSVTPRDSRNVRNVSTYSPVKLALPQPKVYGAHITEDLDTWIAGMRDDFDHSEVPYELRAKILGCFLEGPPAVTYRKAEVILRVYLTC